MRYKFYFLLITTICLVSACYNQEINQEKIGSWIQKYREAKSKEWVSTLSLLPSSNFKKQYWHKDFDTVVGDREKRDFIVLEDDFKVESVTLYENEDYQKKYNRKCYYILGNEKYIGEVVDGEYIHYNEIKIYPIGYLVIKTDSGILSMMDWMYDNYYILEKDVPILLERLKKDR